MSEGDVATDNRYLNYLDKEMTIMGILSTFSVAVVALILDRVGSAENKGSFFYSVWHGSQGHTGEASYILMGSFSVSLAALLFYSQRSMLAWFYGQISLSIESPPVSGTDTEDLYRDADSWATWTLYQLAFTALIVGFAIYGYAVVRALDLVAPSTWVFWSVILMIATVQGMRMLILRRYKYHDDPQWELLEWWLCKRLPLRPLRVVIRMVSSEMRTISAWQTANGDQVLGRPSGLSFELLVSLPWAETFEPAAKPYVHPSKSWAP